MSTPTDQLVAAVGRADPDLGPQERETTIRFAAADESAVIWSEEPALIRRLIAHPDSTVSSMRVQKDGTATQTTPQEYQDGEIVGVQCDVPLGVLKVQATSRTTGTHADIVSKQPLEDYEVTA